MRDISTRKSKNDDLDFQDPVEATGCSEQNDALLLCFDKYKDWRKCQAELNAFRDCYTEYTKKAEERWVKQLTEKIEEKLLDIGKEVEEEMNRNDVPDPDYMSNIPFSTEN